uniref:C-type lectin n=1 Tax=Phalotris mertensi TaxID=1260334 RepID=A0A175KDY2_9SAUR
MLLITCFIFGLLGSLTWAGPYGQSVCPSGTFAFNDGSEWNCYKFYEDKLTFEKAEQECQSRWNGHLASINSDRQANSVGAYVTGENMEGDFVWIGLRRDEGSSMISGWRWVDESPSDYRRWSNNQPDNRGHHQFCGGLDPISGHVTWYDLNCSSKYNFLCKWKLA